MIESPSRSTRVWIACEMSLRWLPGFASAMPSKSASRVVSSSGSASSGVSPIGTVIAASATQPS